MSFQVGICSLGGTVFFQVGLSTPLRTMVDFNPIEASDNWMYLELNEQHQYMKS